MRLQLLLWLIFILQVDTVVFNKKISKPLEPPPKKDLRKVNKSKDVSHIEKYSKDPKEKRQFIPGNQFWPATSYPGFQQAYFQLQQQQLPPPSIFQQQPNLANNFFQQTSQPENYETVSNPSPTKITTKFEDIKEKKEDLEASYKGLSYYTGDLVDPKFLKKSSPNIAGYPVSLDVDKEKEVPTKPPKVTVKQKTRPSINGIDRDQLYVSYATLHYGDQSASSKISVIPNQVLVKPPEIPGPVLTKPPDIKLNKSALPYIGPKITTTKTTVTTSTKASTTTTTTTTTKATTTTSTKPVPKKDCSLCKNKDSYKDEECTHCKGKDGDKNKEKDDNLPDGTMCYLPRIVVNTRLMGTTVINEIKIYTSPRDENSVHRFVTSHEVSDAATKISHEFILPPQFITQKELSAADLKYMNNTPVMITSAYAETNHQHMQIPINMLTQYPMNAIPEDVSPTFNPYLPTKNEDIFNGKHVTVVGKDLTATTSTTTIMTTTPPTTTMTTTMTTQTTTTLTTSTTTTTTTITTTTTTTTTITTTTTTKTVTPQIKKRNLIAALNHAARHRNALLDVPGGDSLAFSRYQILGPPDVHQIWITHKKKRRKRRKK